MSLYAKIYRRFVAPITRPYISKSHPPQIIAMMDGGLGSQMWQFAVGRGAALRSGLPVSFDLSFYDGSPTDIDGRFSRKLEIERTFGIELVRADAASISLYKRVFYRHNDRHSRHIFDPRVQGGEHEHRYLGGYYPHVGYIDWQGDELRDVFTFRLPAPEGANADLLGAIRDAAAPVAIHMRRGDYVGTNFDVTTPAYFKRAADFIASRISPVVPTFFVFSNEPSFAREAVADSRHAFVFADANDNDSGPRDMQLMSECSHFIISNSSFGWWPAWLSRRAHDKIVVMPDRWLSKDMSSEHMKPDGWIALETIRS